RAAPTVQHRAGRRSRGRARPSCARCGRSVYARAPRPPGASTPNRRCSSSAVSQRMRRYFEDYRASRPFETNLAGLRELSESERRVVGLPKEEAPILCFDQGAPAQTFAIEQAAEMQRNLRGYRLTLERLTLNSDEQAEVAQCRQDITGHLLAGALAPLLETPVSSIAF